MTTLPFARLFTTAVVLCTALAFAGCGGCGENNNNPQASQVDVTIVSVSPEASYAGVPVSVSVALEPGDLDAQALTWRVDFGDGQSGGGDGISGETTSTYMKAGDYTINVKALLDGDVVGNAVQRYNVYEDVDLSVSGVSALPPNVQSGTMLVINANVRNVLDADLFTSVDAKAYLSQSRTVTVEDLDTLIELGQGTLSAEQSPVVAAGQNGSLTISSVISDSIASGDYYAVVVLDPSESISDTDRANNFAISDAIIRVENIDQSQADLVVSNVLAAPDRAFAELNTFTRGYTVANPGGLDAFDVVVKTYLSKGDDELDDADTLVSTSAPFNVLSKDSVTVGAEPIVLDTAIAALPNEDLQVYVIVEAVAMQTEGSLENNVAVTTIPILVSDQMVQGPDIVVRSFEVTPESTFLDGTLNIKTTLANEGTTDVGSFFCGLYLGKEARVNTDLDARFASVLVSSLKSGDVLEVDDAKEVPGIYDPGVYFIYMVCDPLNALSEVFRSNNQAIFPNPVTITDQADVDLRVDALAVPAQVTEGDTYSVTATFCVGGTNPTGRTSAALYKSPGQIVDFNAQPIARFDVPSINPGDCADVVVEVEADCEQFQESYALGVEADIDDVVPETDESNNGRTGGNTLTVAGQFCACTEDLFEPNNRATDAKPLGVGVNPAALCDAGTCDFYKIDAQEGDSLIVRTGFDVDKGLVVTTLYNSLGISVLESSRAEIGQEVASFLATDDLGFVVSVCGDKAQTRNLYDLDVQVIPRSTTIDLVPRALTIPQRDTYSIGARVNASFKAYNLGQLPSGDFDAQIFLSTNDIAGDADDIVLKSITISELNAGALRDIVELVSLPTTLVDGTYFMGVTLNPTNQPVESDTTNNSTLSAPIVVVTRCYDALEPNDSFIDAWPIDASGSFSNLLSCAEADDYYEICVADGKKLTVSLNFSDAQGDLDLELFNQQLQGVASSAGAGVDSEQVVVPYVNGAQCYYAQVKIKSVNPMAENTYGLSVDIQDVDPSLLCDAWGEPNNGFTTASSLLAATQTLSLDRCPSADTDFYYVDLNASQTVTFRATKSPSGQAGTLRLQLYNANQTPGPNQETAPDQASAELTNFVAPLTGRYFLQVTVSGNARNVLYTMEVEGLASVDLQPASLVIGPGTYSANDVVRFGFDLANIGTSATAAAPSYAVYLGDQIFNATTDVVLGTFNLATSLGGNSTIGIADQVTLPSNAVAGPRYIHVVAMAPDDSNPANDVTSTPITIIP